MNALPAQKPRTRIQRHNRKEIVDAAIDVIAERGFAGAKMEAISERAGISRSNINYYYRTRTDLFTEVIKKALVHRHALLPLLDSAHAPKESLSNYISARIAAARDHSKLSRVFAADILNGAPLTFEALKSRRSAEVEAAFDTLREWMRRGDLVEADPVHLLILIWAATQYYADFNVLACHALDKEELTPQDFDRAAETIINTVLNGLLVEKTGQLKPN